MSSDRLERLRERVEALTDDQRRLLAEGLADGSAGRSGARLVAFVALSAEGPVPGDLPDFVRARVADYMVPAEYVVLAKLPRTPAGKLDRRALARVPIAPAASRVGASSEPSTEAERVLAEIWKDALGTDEIDVNDDFFELGGDSILSIRVIARANEAGLSITPQQFFASPTVASLAAAAVRSG